LHKKIHVVFISPDLQKYDFLPLGDFQTHRTNYLIDIFAENHPSIFRRTDNVIQQESNVMALADVLAHPSILSVLRGKPRGMYPP